jgi:hypothetical protein
MSADSVTLSLAYGIPVYFVMNHIVLPLSAIPFQVSHTLGHVVTAVLILMFCVGLPIALVIRRFAK